MNNDATPLTCGVKGVEGLKVNRYTRVRVREVSSKSVRTQECGSKFVTTQEREGL